MEIHIIGNSDNKKKRLNLLLAEHYPKYDIISQERVSELKESAARTNIALLVIILTNKNVKIVEQLLGFNDLQTPVLFVEEEATDMREEYLNRTVVKGYIRRNAPLEKIKSAMNLVLEGGIYKDPTALANPITKTKNKKELELDWTILSMYSKGFNLSDISEIVNLPIDTLSERIERIKTEVIFKQTEPIGHQ